MATLFLLSHAPHADPGEGKQLALAKRGDSVVLIEDAVYAGGPTPTPLSPILQEVRARGLRLYVLTPDLEARGVVTKLPQVDYEGLVTLIEAHDRVVH